MRPPRHPRPNALAMALACAMLGGNATQSAAAATPAPTQASQTALMRQLEKMNTRLDELERRNAELERRLAERATSPAAAPAELQKRVETLEQTQDRIAKGLESDRISENEPELTARLKATEKDALDMKHAAKKIDALDGISASASLTTVTQRPAGLPQGTEGNHSQLSYRADITATLPLEHYGDIEHKLFAHFRLGQNTGLNAPLANLGGFASTANGVGFHASGAVADDSPAILGEAWYQAAIPLPFGGFKPNSRETLELTFGKMDLFGFFDQNAVAGDESRQFLNSIFVHNPLLDAGGQVGMDANGFQPGFVAAYVNQRNKPEHWRLSLGMFGARDGSRYRNSFSAPLVMAQAEGSLHPFPGLPGNYRLYAWRNGAGEQLDGSNSTHAGWGISADQRVADGITLFGRYGHQASGKVRFDRALVLGGEIGGSAWNRGADALGIAWGRLRASSDFRSAGGSGDLIGDGSGVFAYAPEGAEQTAELYYRYRLTKQFELTPDLQVLRRAGANPDATTIKVLGLRAMIAF